MGGWYREQKTEIFTESQALVRDGKESFLITVVGGEVREDLSVFKLRPLVGPSETNAKGFNPALSLFF